MGGGPITPVLQAQSVGLEFSSKVDYPTVKLMLCDVMDLEVTVVCWVEQFNYQSGGGKVV